MGFTTYRYRVTWWPGVSQTRGPLRTTIALAEFIKAKQPQGLGRLCPQSREEAQSKVYKEGIENLKTALKLHESLASRSIAIKVQKDPCACFPDT